MGADCIRWVAIISEYQTWDCIGNESQSIKYESLEWLVAAWTLANIRAGVKSGKLKFVESELQAESETHRNLDSSTVLVNWYTETKICSGAWIL